MHSDNCSIDWNTLISAPVVRRNYENRDNIIANQNSFYNRALVVPYQHDAVRTCRFVKTNQLQLNHGSCVRRRGWNICANIFLGFSFNILFSILKSTGWFSVSTIKKTCYFCCSLCKSLVLEKIWHGLLCLWCFSSFYYEVKKHAGLIFSCSVLLKTTCIWQYCSV